MWNKLLSNDCITCKLKKPYPNKKQIAEKQDFKVFLLFNQRNSFDTKVTNINILRGKLIYNGHY